MAAIAQITQEEEIGRGDLTDAQWVKLKPLLPPQKARTGKPAKDHRQIINRPLAKVFRGTIRGCAIFD